MAEVKEVFDTAGSHQFVVPAGVTDDEITVKSWGAGGGGGETTTGTGGVGGGGGFAQATSTETEGTTINIEVGAGGAGGSGGQSAGAGGGGGGASGAYSGTVSDANAIAEGGGGGGGGGGDNVAGGNGGAGGAGGGATAQSGGASGTATGGGGASGATVGSAGASGGNAGSGDNGGDGADGAGTVGGSAAAGGTSGGGNGGDGGLGASTSGGAGGGGGGQAGGGGGGTTTGTGNSGAGGGGGSSIVNGTSTTQTTGSGQTPGNSGDSDRGGAGDGGGIGVAGDAGRVVIIYDSTLPSITDVDPQLIRPGNSTTITGVNIDHATLTESVWLADSNNFATATKTEQTDTGTFGATSVVVNEVVLGALSQGDLFMFVVHDEGGASEAVSNAFPVTVSVTDVKVASGVFTTNASTGAQTLVDSLTFEPKLAIFFVSGNTSDDTAQTGCAVGIGAVDDDGRSGYATAAVTSGGTRDAAGNRDGNFSATASTEPAIALLSDGADQTLDFAATATLTDDGIDINVSTALANLRVHWLAIGGRTCQAQIATSGVDSSPITGIDLGFDSDVTPDGVFMFSHCGGLGGSAGFHLLACGAFDGTDEAWTCINFENAASAQSKSTNNGCLAQLNTLALTWEMSAPVMTTTGMSWTGTDTDDFIACFLWIDGLAIDVNTFIKSTSAAPANQSVSLSFDPGAVILVSGGKDNETATTNDGFGAFSMGFVTEDNQSNIFTTDTAADPYNVDQITDAAGTAIRLGDADVGIDSEGVVTLGTDEFDVDWDPNDTAESTIVMYMAIETSAAEVDVSGDVTLGAVTATGNANLTHSASGAVTLGAVQSTGNAELEHFVSGAVTLGALVSAGNATLTFDVSGAVTLAALSATGDANHEIPVSGTMVLAPLAASGNAELEHDVSGAVTLGALVSAGNAELEHDVSGAVTLGAIQVTGNVTLTFDASGAVVLAALEATGVADKDIEVSGAVTLGAIQVTGNAQLEHFASGAVTLAALSATGALQLEIPVSGTISIGALQSDGTATLSHDASGAVTIGALEASGSAELGAVINVSGDIVLPALRSRSLLPPKNNLVRRIPRRMFGVR